MLATECSPLEANVETTVGDVAAILGAVFVGKFIVLVPATVVVVFGKELVFGTTIAATAAEFGTALLACLFCTAEDDGDAVFKTCAICPDINTLASCFNDTCCF